jgi:hypothetical protein
MMDRERCFLWPKERQHAFAVSLVWISQDLQRWVRAAGHVRCGMGRCDRKLLKPTRGGPQMFINIACHIDVLHVKSTI